MDSRIWVFSQALEEQAEREGWTLMDTNEGMAIQADDESVLNITDDDAVELARAAGVPCDHRGLLLKYVVHWRSLEGFAEDTGG